MGDSLEDIRLLVQQASQRCDVAISTGGLGPTDDDLTARAVAQAFERPLELDTEALEQIKGYYGRANRVMPKVNEKQAYLPKGSLRLDNHWGTAPAFAVEENDTWMAFLPGVPREMKQIFGAYIPELLSRKYSLQPGRLVTIRTTGIGESAIQERLGSPTLEHAVISYRTKLPENHVKLRFTPAASDSYIEQTTNELATKIGSAVFAIDGIGPDGGALMEVVGKLLQDSGRTLAVAESCTGGRVASMCTGVAGSSTWFKAGFITYSNASKVDMVGVEPEAIARNGAVSEQVARQLAEGARGRAGTDFGLATTGVAGPGGGSDEKPVGTVHIALATADHTYHRRLSLGGRRERIQLSAAAVIDLLRRHLQGLL